MSKSKGNFFTLRDLMEKGYDPIDIRYVYLTAHYRSVLDFSLKALDQAKAARRRLLEFKARMSELAGSELGDGGKLAFVEQCRERFEAALDDDLDMPKALAALFELVAEGNRAADAGELSAADAAAALAFLHSADRVLGVLVEKEAMLPEEIEALIEERIAARKNKDFKRADQIRDELAEKGIILKDTPQGTRWQWK
jgi:cysteinyl-tRNA synthetase